MSTLKGLLEKSINLNEDIKNILKYADYERYYDLSGLEINSSDPDELMLLDELQDVISKLSDVSNILEYLSKAILMTGYLVKNQLGRYELDNGKHYYTSGNRIEAYIYDDYNESYKWVISTVEHNGKDYYVKGYPTVKMDGLQVRIRG